MTGGDSAQRLIQGLSADLTPVRRVLRLRVAMALVVGVTAVLVAGLMLLYGPRAGLLRDLLVVNGYGGVFAGLLVAGLGGTAAALAGGVPGREPAFWAGAAVAMAGLLGAVLVTFFSALSAGSGAGSPLASNLHCFQRAVGFGLLPGTALGVLVLRGWVARPLLAASIALLGAVALGGVVAHLGCRFTDPRHLLLGHSIPPLVLAAVGAWPVGVLLRRFGR